MRQVIRLTENDLHRIVKNSVKKILKERYDDIEDYNEYPSFKNVIVYFNLNTKECVEKWKNAKSDGLWVGVELEATDYESGDDGIGQYEYWGQIGYDSRPYVKVTECQPIDIVDDFLIQNGQHGTYDEEITLDDLSQEDIDIICNYAINLFEQN